MKLTYVAHTRFPTEKAHGHQIAQVCAALAEGGHEVTLVTPNIRNFFTADPFSYYGIPRSFHILKLKHFDAWKSRLVPGFLNTMIGLWFYGRALKSHLRDHPSDLLYVRSPLLLRPLLSTGIPVILELHALPARSRRRFVADCNRCRRVVCLTSPMARALEEWGVNPRKIMVEADGVNLSAFQNLLESAEAKRQWELPDDRTVIGYAGSLVTRETMEKGVKELIDAVAIMHQHHKNSLLWIVGGPGSWVERYREYVRSIGLHDAVRFEGPVDPSRVPVALRACDVLVYPAPLSNHPYFLRDTSPLKVFEYLASGVPVVCADLPPLRDVVNETTVRFCAPGDAQSMSLAIDDVLAHPAESARRAEKAKVQVQHHSWTLRMKRIVDTTAESR